MKIALLGYGKMGKAIERLAPSVGCRVVAIISPSCEQTQLSPQAVFDADVCIDFSRSQNVLRHATMLAELKKPLVIGTTGWDESLESVRLLIARHQSACVHSPNFSLGVALFDQMVAKAAALMQPYDAYDCSLLEVHHRQKADSPSGTGLKLAQTILSAMPRKTEMVTSLPNHALDSNALHVASVRCGSVPGTHTVTFDSLHDTIELTHTARTRDGFALGALLAAKWIHNKKGFYTFTDVIKDIS